MNRWRRPQWPNNWPAPSNGIVTAVIVVIVVLVLLGAHQHGVTFGH